MEVVRGAGMPFVLHVESERKDVPPSTFQESPLSFWALYYCPACSLQGRGPCLGMGLTCNMLAGSRWGQEVHCCH